MGAQVGTDGRGARWGGDDGVDEALLGQVLGGVVKSSSIVEFNKVVLA